MNAPIETVPIRYVSVSQNLSVVADTHFCGVRARAAIQMQVRRIASTPVTGGVTSPPAGWDDAVAALPSEWTGPPIMCVGARLLNLLPVDDMGRPDLTVSEDPDFADAMLIVQHDKVSEEIVIYVGAAPGPADGQRPQLATRSDVPIWYQSLAPKDIETSFSASSCPRNGRVVIDAAIQGTHFAAHFAGAEMEAVTHKHIGGDGTVYVSGALTGPYLICEGGTVELLVDDHGNDWTGKPSTGRFAITHDGTSNLIIVRHGAAAATPDPRPGIVPIRFLPARPDMRASFDNDSCPWGGRVVINAAAFDAAGGDTLAGGHIERVKHSLPDGTATIAEWGQRRTLTCTGAALEFLADDNGERWSGDMSTGRFALEHDGISREITVTFSTATG